MIPTISEPVEGQADAAAALLAANRRRRRIRRWVLIGTLPLTLAALLFVGKLLSMYGFAHQAISTYVVGDYSGSTSAAQSQEFLNWFEPYKAPYNLGTALAGAEELDAARSKLEEALPLASGLEVCAVRVNLALVIERQGDAARADGDGPGSVQLYGEALKVTAETPEECDSEEADQQSPDPDRSMSDTLGELQDRLQEKQQQSDQQQNPDRGDEQQQTQPNQDKLDELQKKLEQGAEERQQNQGDEDGPGGGTDKPW
ncbi:tetratricopeptide repeat protein [Microbacterium sp. A196]|uniref:tetratricopeptide repeat protein n=1 Tax=unclassified Microbacterium TaxID=2609290 RepID=UPI003FD492E8